jgi:hypothetical protein
MAIRNVVRGTLDWEQLERVFREFARRHDREEVRVRFIDADNWLSIPAVVDEEWFVKIVTPQNAFVHSLFTVGRNIGAVSRGREGFFDRYADPVSMAEHELQAIERMRSAGIDAPTPVEAFEVDGLGVLVVEYIPEFRTLGELTDDELRTLAPDLFERLRVVHDHEMAHGDLRQENVLLSGDRLYFIDATKVRTEDEAAPNALADARAYDLACALAMLAPRVGPRAAVEAATQVYDAADLLDALEFLDVVALRPDHDFAATEVKTEIETVATP